jgi:hypothetical protein
MILHLSLYAEYFSAILAGTKQIEYRRRCDRWDKMLIRPYHRIHFVNGYGKHRPWMILTICFVVAMPITSFSFRRTLQLHNGRAFNTNKPTGHLEGFQLTVLNPVIDGSGSHAKIYSHLIGPKVGLIG